MGPTLAEFVNGRNVDEIPFIPAIRRFHQRWFIRVTAFVTGHLIGSNPGPAATYTEHAFIMSKPENRSKSLARRGPPQSSWRCREDICPRRCSTMNHDSVGPES